MSGNGILPQFLHSVSVWLYWGTNFSFFSDGERDNSGGGSPCRVGQAARFFLGSRDKISGVFPLPQALRFKEHFILPSALHQLAEGDCIVTSAELFIRPRQKVNTDAEFLIKGGLFRPVYSATTTPKHTHSADATPGLSIMWPQKPVSRERADQADQRPP